MAETDRYTLEDESCMASIIGAWVAFKSDADKYLANGNQSAARRSRKQAMELTKLLKRWRGLTTGRIQA